MSRFVGSAPPSVEAMLEERGIARGGGRWGGPLSSDGRSCRSYCVCVWKMFAPMPVDGADSFPHSLQLVKGSCWDDVVGSSNSKNTRLVFGSLSCGFRKTSDPS
jgi:hypothetical protein